MFCFSFILLSCSWCACECVFVYVWRLRIQAVKPRKKKKKNACILLSWVEQLHGSFFLNSPTWVGGVYPLGLESERIRVNHQTVMASALASAFHFMFHISIIFINIYTSIEDAAVPYPEDHLWWAYSGRWKYLTEWNLVSKSYTAAANYSSQLHTALIQLYKNNHGKRKFFCLVFFRLHSPWSTCITLWMCCACGSIKW